MSRHAVRRGGLVADDGVSMDGELDQEVHVAALGVKPVGQG